jgi:hypothetical protein
MEFRNRKLPRAEFPQGTSKLGIVTMSPKAVPERPRVGIKVSAAMAGGDLQKVRMQRGPNFSGVRVSAKYG